MSDDKTAPKEEIKLYEDPPVGPELWTQQGPEDAEILGNVHIHEVTPSGRYVVVVSYLGVEVDEAWLLKTAKLTQAALEHWWQSQDKFLVLASGPDFEVLVTRVDEEVEITVAVEDEPR